MLKNFVPIFKHNFLYIKENKRLSTRQLLQKTYGTKESFKVISNMEIGTVLKITDGTLRNKEFVIVHKENNYMSLLPNSLKTEGTLCESNSLIFIRSESEVKRLFSIIKKWIPKIENVNFEIVEDKTCKAMIKYVIEELEL